MRVKRWLSAVGGLLALALVTTALTSPPAPRAERAAVTAASRTSVERGRLVYERYGCGLCHGSDGKGGFANPNAETESKVPGVIYSKEGYTAAELHRLILNGTPRIGKADPNAPTPPYRMPGWRERMSEREVSDLVEYLFSLYPESEETKWR